MIGKLKVLDGSRVVRRSSSQACVNVTVLGGVVEMIDILKERPEGIIGGILGEINVVKRLPMPE
jgi:hypothetical protein